MKKKGYQRRKIGHLENEISKREADGEMSLSGLLSSRNGDFADDKFCYQSYCLKRVGFIRVLFVTVSHV